MKSLNINVLKTAYLEKVSIPVFMQIILFYTVIVFSIFLLMAYITFTSVHQALVQQNQKELQLTVDRTLGYLNLYQNIDASLLTKAPPLPYTTVQIFSNEGVLLLDNVTEIQRDSYLKNIENTDKIKDGQLITTQSDRGVPVFIKNYHWQARDGKIYMIRFSIITTKEELYRNSLKDQFITVSFIGFLLAIGIGTVLAWRLIKPISAMQKTLSSIDFNHLEKRIPVPKGSDEIYSFAVSVNKTLDRLQDGANQQKQFINDASHELRTPITVIQGYTDMLMRWGKDDAETLDEGLQAIDQETKYMKNLIENLLFLARSSQGPLSLSMAPVSVNDLLEAAYETDIFISRKQDLILENPRVGNILGDFNLLLQLLRIFLENAGKYTPAGGKIFLTAKEDKKSREIIVTVRDTGIGIPKDQQEKIFERFYRVDESRTKDTGGNGLGLAIAAQIIKIHKAKIIVDSDINQGTAMIVHFPIWEETNFSEKKNELDNDDMDAIM